MAVSSIGSAQSAMRTGAAPAVTARSWYTLGVLTIAYVLNLVDRKLPFILVEPIRRDLHLSDTQIGLITGAMFMLIYCAFSLPVAKAADKISRKWVLVGAVALWSLMTSAGGLARNFWQLGAARAGVAIGESGCMPASHSMLADIFPPDRRATVSSIFMAGAPVGMLLGLAGGGIINDIWDWRTAMIMVGAPGLVIASLIILTVQEPPRRAAPEDTAKVGVWQGAKVLFGKATFRHIAAASLVGGLASAAGQSFGPAFIMRTYGMSTTETGISYGLLVGVGGIVGSLLGGFVNDRMRSRDERWGIWFVAGMHIVMAPLMVLAWRAPTFPGFAALLFIPQVAFMVHAGPIIPTVQRLAGPAMGAIAVAIYLLMSNGLGVSFGPVLAGMLSDALRPAMGEASLQGALVAVTLLQLWSGFHYFMAASRLRADLARS